MWDPNPKPADGNKVALLASTDFWSACVKKDSVQQSSPQTKESVLKEAGQGLGLQWFWFLLPIAVGESSYAYFSTTEAQSVKQQQWQILKNALQHVRKAKWYPSVPGGRRGCQSHTGRETDCSRYNLTPNVREPCHLHELLLRHMSFKVPVHSCQLGDVNGRVRVLWRHEGNTKCM